MSISFRKYLSSQLDVEEDRLSTILESCSVKTFDKGEYLLRAKEHCHNTFFVEEGLLRQYTVDEKGKEHIVSFAPEGWFVSDRESVYFNEPSVYFIQALEHSRVVLIDENLIQKLSREIPGFSAFNNRLLHNHIRHLQKRMTLLLGASAEERYLQFLKMYPDVLLRVPQSMVASYLGITPESLSRVRKALVKR